ncbi:MAG: long-chain fatty acid--CoA ligase [Bacteroidetes bacterium]|nr:long-chain fatty acid--CoA ligase [Bacteroidota bacterium]
MQNTEKQTWEEIKNLPLILKVNSQRYGSSVAVDSVDGTSYTYLELERSARFLASRLHSAGIEKGSKVAIISENSPHWTLSYFGILTTGATTVPILPDFRGSEIISILEHSEARAIFISGKLISRLEAGLPKEIELVVNLDNFQILDVENGKIVKPGGEPGKLEKLNTTDDTFPGEASFYNAVSDDLANIIYTSGTTGRSKGVMLSHMNILSNAKQSATVHVVVPEDRLLSMLPLAHSYECTIGMAVPLLNGARIYYIEKPPTAAYLAPLLQKLKPTTLLTVPLIMEKIFAGKIKPALYGSPVMRTLMKFGPTRKLLSRAASKKLQAFFGGELRFFGIGGAPLAPDVERFLIDGKFPYAIGYGLTETSPMLAGFAPQHAIYRSVGKVMDGVTIRIDNPDPVTHEGEIVAQGSNIMKGYYKEPEKTAEVFTNDGYFRTGDLGYIDMEGIIYIRGRLKNMILGPNGENIYPEEIEAVINKEDIVSESLVMESAGKLVAMVHLRVEAMEERFKHLKDNATDFQQQLHEKTDEVLAELMIQVNQHVARNSKLQQIILQVQPFEKTPTQKIKRFLYQQKLNFTT